ncbi:MAG: carbohydrate binding family 9 domain-containing protein [Sphingomonadales bacterium]|nr:carbohydrate binding family 9 domain-containing protein [Sphingomonadales bacterium]
MLACGCPKRQIIVNLPMRLQLLLLLLLLSFSTYGQKQINAIRCNEKITIDGKLQEATWSKNPEFSPFIQIKPEPGKPSKSQTSIQLCYDQDAIYFAFYCQDPPDSISKVLSLRDDYNPNLDIIGIFLDTYNDNQNGFYFGLTSRGVQLDAKIAANDYNDQLNLVWHSAVEIVENGWIAEIRIPYSALRFPQKEVQDWGINIGRQIARLREESSWVAVNPDLENMLLESGDITNLSNISPPLRLALIPYVSTYVDEIRNEDNSKSLLRSFNGGMDIKYGINEAFTLDLTLVPDFGQVVFDQQVLNLTPFEIQFNENRQFFTEGMELFNKAGIFYSRRIGIQAPYKVTQTMLQPNEYLENVPGSSQLYNAFKISGRDSHGLGIGFFNAVNAEQIGTAVSTLDNSKREVLVSPLTNYNVLVFDQNLKNNSSLTFTNTSVWRAGSFYDANVSAFNFNLNTKDNNYNINGKGILSAQLDATNTLGHNINLNVQKQRGALIGGLGYLQESDTYDPNDLGFNYNNNRRIFEASVAYRNFTPKWQHLMKWSMNASFSQSYLYLPNVFTSNMFSLKAFAVSKKFNAFGLNAGTALQPSKDYFEPRTWGAVFTVPQFAFFNYWFSTNYQRKIALDAGASMDIYYNNPWKQYAYNFEPRIRLSDAIFLVYSFEKELQINSLGYAIPFATPVQSYQGILFGKRDRNTTIQFISLDYIVTNRMSLSLRLRHYRSTLKYQNFSILQQDGSLNPLPDFNGLTVEGKSAYDINYNAFTIDFMYRWVFMPGSEINIVWKNAVFSNNDAVNVAYWQDLSGTLQNGALNSFSIKLIYWLDAQQLRKDRSFLPR